MKKFFSLMSICFLSVILYAQNIVQVGKGSYAEYPPDAVTFEDGYFAAPYDWFKQAWPLLNLHDNVRNRPLPSNHWWTDFVYKGLSKVQPGGAGTGPVSVATTGSRFGTEAWAYPQIVDAGDAGFDVFFPKDFSGGGMVKGNPLKINASATLQSNDDNILFEDFEETTWAQMTGWTVTVNNGSGAFTGPMLGASYASNKGYNGDRLLSTRDPSNVNGRLFTIISPKFTIEKKYIKLLVAGGNNPDLTYVGLFINNERVRNECGTNGTSLTARTWDVSEYVGQQAEIRIVDNSTASYGYILCDDIAFTDSQYGGSGYSADFRTTVAKIYDWSDLGFTLRSEDGTGNMMDATIVHGVPFTYVEFTGLYPILIPDGTASVYDVNGQQITTFPVALNAFTIESNGKVYGIHAPLGTIVRQSKAGDFQLETPAGKRYVVVSVLPNRSLLGTYDQYARNKPGNVRYIPEYKVEEGKIVTTFDMNTTNLETGATNQPTLMSFLPHHYRTTTKNFDFIAGADYRLILGLMHTGAGSSFALSYNFGGMPPYLPEPLDMPQERKDMLNSLLTWYSTQTAGFDGNTYAKGLGEKSTGMLMDKMMDNQGFDVVKNNLKNQYADWLDFTDAERAQKSRYFARYPDYGALIGFPPGYGSQGFNDLHFHIGYFTVGAARLMMVDPEFKKDYGDMVKLITKTYANWEHYQGADDGTANYQPFLRTFDPYFGHSFAGGTGDGGGNNQESTSEAINSWFGMYMLGVELNDKAIIDCGAAGYMLENLAAGEYWLDLYKENLPSTYGYPCVGILRTGSLAWATYFSGDPAWVLGIQACPVDFYYRDFGIQPDKMNSNIESMMTQRTAANASDYPGNADPYENIKSMGPYVGGYLLNILNYVDPVRASQWLDDYCNDPAVGQQWRNHLNTVTNYYMSNAMITYGKPAEGYYTSIPSGAVYINEAGELTYLLYNATNSDVDVKIYKDGVVIDTIRVGAGKYYNSRVPNGYKPAVAITTYKDNDKMAINKEVKITASASDKDGRVLWVDFYCDGEKIGTSYIEPFEVPFTPTQAGIKELKAIAIDDDGLESDPAIVSVEVLATEQRPFNGRQPWNVPTETIYAVQFDDGGPEISCHTNNFMTDTYRPNYGIRCEGTGNLANSDIGYSNVGMWIEYTINVQATGVYQMIAKVGSRAGGALRIFIDGTDMTGSAPVPAGTDMGVTGLTLFEFNLAKIPLTAGKHIMRVMVDKVPNGLNMNSFRFTATTDAMPPEVDAGADRVIEYPVTSVTLNASAITYGTATVSKYEWTQIDSNASANIATPDQAETLVSGLQAGTYVFEVKITDSNGSEATGRVVVLMTGGPTLAISSPKTTNSNISIYPNPFTDQLVIQLGEGDGFKRLRLSSITGKVVMEENIQNQSVLSLNTSGLAKGYYILTLVSDKGVISRKVVK